MSRPGNPGPLGPGGRQVEHIRLGLDDAHRELVEGVHWHRIGRAVSGRRRDVPELLSQDLRHQNRTVSPDCEILQEGVRRKHSHRGEACL